MNKHQNTMPTEFAVPVAGSNLRTGADAAAAGAVAMLQAIAAEHGEMARLSQLAGLLQGEAGARIEIIVTAGVAQLRLQRVDATGFHELGLLRVPVPLPGLPVTLQ